MVTNKKRQNPYQNSKQPYKKRQYNAPLYNAPVQYKGTKTEKKFLDVSFTLSLPFGAATWVAPAAAQLLNGLTLGSTASQRIGRRVTFRSIYIRGKLVFGAAVTNSCQARYLVVYDKQANAALPATTDILLNDDYLSPNNISNNNRFIIVADKTTASVDAAQVKNISFKLYRKLMLETQFNAGNAGTIADITTGSLFIIGAQSGGAGAANPSMQFQVRLRYDDI